ncbi:hypothetical protein Naga_101579g2 [Nannochloropsis gaditana]|uniref:Uncharacterized protein n=1 Tax=Nannochloropsis gaditana TaxID=72520 RepID=W7TKU6_9STRA|nr:hypothetical protein Naga_101579g2 [Nannochloropsis gaditana]
MSTDKSALPADYIAADELSAVLRLATATMEESINPGNGAPNKTENTYKDQAGLPQPTGDADGGEEGGISKRMLKKMAKGKLKEKKEKKLPNPPKAKEEKSGKPEKEEVKNANRSRVL